MVKDRRRTERHPVAGIVHIQGGAGTATRECRLTDISEGGVRLYAEGMSVPDHFVLWLPQGARVRRHCRVVWRLGYEIGAEFTDRAPEEFAQSVLRASVGRR